jgi:hypothetical protein
VLGVTYKTAWFMCHRIREAMKDDGSPLGGPGKVVESDEAFISGKKKKRLSGKVAPMKKVMTLVERDGRARSFDPLRADADGDRPEVDCGHAASWSVAAVNQKRNSADSPRRI